ncbi:ATP-binding cassette domain-containing protein [Erysipelothrix anatis]|uniref:ATP-binding cassette domain-containing protein n=1 Tax=Erysipelothrix anatis TaxID=2683713 RepID=UPI00135856D1|nr:ATP-binding cassette domain-containing protein [Erysipelothrix anatis]
MIKLNELIKERDAITIGPLNFAIHQGELVLLAGKNGKGKSTTLKVMAGILEPNGGSITYDDLAYSEYIKNHTVAYMPDKTPFPSDANSYTIHDILSVIYRTYDKKTWYEKIANYKIPINIKVNDLSKGQSRMLMFATVQAVNADVWLLDEPTLGLDTKSLNDTISGIQDYLIDESKTVVVATNNVEDFERIADRIIYFKEGQIQFDAAPIEIIERFKLWQGDADDVPLAGVINTWRHEFGTQALIDTHINNSLDNLELLSLEKIMYYLERKPTRRFMTK